MPPEGTNDPDDLLLAASSRLHEELSETLAEESGVDAEYRQRDSIVLAASEAEAAMMRAAGASGTRWLERDEVRRVEPRIAPDVPGGLWLDGYHHVEPYKLTLALWQAAERRGARLRYGTVTDLLRRGSSVTGVTVGDERLEADAVVIAAGPWTHVAAEWLGIDLPVYPLKGQIMRLRAPGAPLAAALWWGGDYAGSRSDGLVWSGTTEERVGFDENPTPEGRDQVTRSLLGVLPFMEDAELVKQTACLRPVVPDGMPVIGQVPGIKGAVVATAAGRKGIMLGPAMGQAAADLALCKRPAIDLRAFSPARFE
ncbi:MAG: FAD-binding oxidoreductase [Chloroflexi bacterium]|nr:FAD-binding oxidoreductase [Chloroflexota bacterium]